MTDTHPSRTGADRSEADDVARLLPPPPEWDLAPERTLHHKERLMRQINDDTVRTAETGVPGRRRVLRPAIVAPVAALALAGALTAGLTLGGQDHGGTTRTLQAGGGAHARQASVLLGRISDAALDGRTLSVRDDQFVYVKSEDRGADETSGKAVMGPPVVREFWATQDPGRVQHIALVREDGETYWTNAFLGDEGGTPVGIDRATYKWLAALPTDPDALLKYLYAKTPEEEGQSRDQAVFERIGGLASGLLPPRTAAALYRAAARIPGVVTAPDAHDGKGRTGIGIAREDKKYAERSEWVFDKDLRFLGSRTYLTQDKPVGRKGTLLASTAVLAMGVADKAGVRPAEVTDVTGDGGAEES
ncbi:CU044_5270 family protein [Streptomyces sp. DSM 41982]|uniref:CU044_5270 family protein n=2 Tax=Streptomyces TaxID=1883 RepID=A0ABD5E6R0_9ACTN|nr:CU044_5270 family protein [Streptomyces sp. DSM 41982]MDT0417111.1 CU044_5270 family protein [Streptomyces sp. DSM 41982]